MIILTMGDPNGIGPEIICRFFGQKIIPQEKVLIIGPEEPILYFCKLFSIKKFWEKRDDLDSPLNSKIILYSKGVESFKFNPGTPAIDAGYISGTTLKIACDLLKKGISSTLVTCPLNKDMLIQGGFNFPGHTEFLAREFGLTPEDICMHLLGPRLRVSLVTTHPPLKQVPHGITRKKILKCLLLTWDMLKSLSIATKPIGVCGLNPHAGEGGKIGTEEINIIRPAIEKAQELGIRVLGPYPADTLFHRAFQGEFSAVLAMYHDQGLGPLKLVHFNEAVNITLGLPIIRTSVDHGTAYDIVGKGIANTTSLKNAIAIGIKLSKKLGT